MSQGFNLKFDRMRENLPANTDSDQQDHTNPARYDTPGYTRNVCFVWPDGKRMFFNYAYLVSAEFIPKEDMNEIKLEFSSHTVTLMGYGLEELFVEFLDHLPRSVSIVDGRYALNMKNISITTIHVKDKG